MDFTIEKFEDIDKITAVVCRPTPSLVVKHTVSLKRKVQADAKNPPVERGYVFAYNAAGIKGVYFDYRGSIVLEGRRMINDIQGGTYQKKINCVIEMRDTAGFLNRLETAYYWLIGEKNKETFLHDSKGCPIRIQNSSQKTVAVLSQSAYVAFKPCIIRDTNDTAYEGIAMGNEHGEISNFTAHEFASFYLHMNAVLPNLYLATNTLVQTAMQYCTQELLYRRLLKQ
jgi:hypothetical protein